MTKKKGLWVREGDGEILVRGEVKNDWMKVRKKPGKMKPEDLRPQHLTITTKKSQRYSLLYPIANQ